METHPYFRCIRCHSALSLRSDEGLACSVCAAIYPSIEGVKVLVSNPSRLLEIQLDWLAERRQEAVRNRAKLLEKNGHSPAALSLALAALDGRLANLNLLDLVLLPVKEHLAGQRGRKSLFDAFFLGGSGKPSLRMLGYFYRDWGETAEARFLTDLFLDGIDRFGGETRVDVAVLGCGAGRLLHELAAVFPQVFGVDLSVDSLLLVNALLAGAEVDLHFTFPRPEVPLSQKTVKIKGPVQRRNGIDLVAANANKLPFNSASLSCVITPYLLDVVQTPDAIISEIHRVLSPGGIWINFSNLGNSTTSVASYNPLNSLDLATYLRRSGFTLLDQAMHRFTLVDLSALSEWAHSTTEAPVLFIAAKHGDRERRDFLAEHFSGQGESIWEKLPRLSAYVALGQERVFTAGGIQERKTIAAFNADSPDFRRTLSGEHAMVAEWLVRNLDASRSLRGIFDLMRQQYGEIVSADDFLTLFGEMQDSELIELQSP